MDDKQMTDPKDLDALVKAARQQASSSDNTAPAPTKPTSSNSANKGGLAKIRTYEHDAKTAIHDTNASLARIKLAEDKRERIANNSRPSGKIFWVILILLILIGGGIAGYLFLQQGEEVQQEIIAEEKPQTILTYDSHIDVTPSQLSSLQNDALGTTYIRVRENEEISPLDVVAKNTFGLLPTLILRNNSDYMLGQKDGNMFLIIKSDYQYALPGMLSFEQQFAREVFSDYPVSSGILRGNNSVAYLVMENGNIVITSNINSVRDVALSL